MLGKRIGVDLDDVVADLMTPWLNRYNKENGTTFTPDDLTQWSMTKNLGCTGNQIYKHLTPDLYDNEVRPIPGTLEALEEIRAAGGEPAFVTSCKDSETYMAKVRWLTRNGFGAFKAYGTGEWSPYKTKNEAPVDWLVDDHIGNLEGFTRGYPVLVTRPHNRLLKWEGKRIKHLRDVVPMLKYGEPVKAGFGEVARDGAEQVQSVRQFTTGATRDVDTGKLDYEAFFSPAVLRRRAEFMHKNRFQRDGSMRAGDNWQKGIPVDVYMKSLTRHFMVVWEAHRAGKPLPQEEVCALMFNAEGLLHEDLKAQTPISTGLTT